MIQHQSVWAMMLLIVSMASLMPTHLWAQNGAPLSPDQIDALVADENHDNLPNISYTYTERGFKIRVSYITLDHVVDYTLNGVIITSAINELIDLGIITLTQTGAEGFEFDVDLGPELLPEKSEFGVTLDNNLKLSSVIYDEDKSVIFPIGGLFADVFDWSDQSSNRMLVKGYVWQLDNCGWYECYNAVPYQLVNIYTHNGQNWVYNNTVQSDAAGYYRLLIDNHCGSVAAHAAKDGKEVWQHQDVWTSCSPSINEQSINLKLR